MPTVSNGSSHGSRASPSDATVVLAAAVSLLIFAWGLGEIIRSF
jgi:hypothetical protein